MADVYDAGDAATLTITFANASGTPANPGTVHLRIWPPGAPGTVLTHGTPQPWGSIAQSNVGTFTCRLTLSQGGYWRWTWSGTGDAPSAEQGRFFVRYPHHDPYQ